MDREKLDGWCEQGILALVLALLVFGPVALGSVEVWQFLVLQGLTVAVMVLWIARLWLGQRPQLLWPPIAWAVVAFVAYTVVRYFQSDIEYVAREELIKILVYAFLFFAILNNLHRQESVQIIAMTLVFLGLAISGYAIYEFVTKSETVLGVVSTYRGRAGGTFYNPNNLAGFLELILPLGLCCMLTGRLPHVTKIMLGYASAVMLAGVGVTLSRGGWITTGVILLILCGTLLFHRNYRLQALVLLLVLGAGGYLVAPRVEAARERFAKINSSGKPDDVRLTIWAAALRMWQDNLWLGVGPGEFDYRFRQYRPLELQQRPDRVHNDYLNTLVDYGAAGTALVCAAWALLFYGVARTWKHVRAAPDDFARKKSNKFAFMLGSAVGLLGILIHSLVDFHLHIPGVAVVAVALMALLSSQWRFATERYWFRAGIWRKCAVTAGLAAGVVVLVGTGWRAGMEAYYLHQAEHEYQLNPFSYAQIEKLKRAWQVEPRNFETTYTIAESYRNKSWAGGDNYVSLARQAMEWYQRGMAANPYDGYNWIGYGMCLDWIGQQSDSDPYFKRGDELDPNGYFTSVKIANHWIELGDFAAARTWFLRSRRLLWDGNDVADNYLPIVERRLQEAADAPALKRASP